MLNAFIKQLESLSRSYGDAKVQVFMSKKEYYLIHEISKEEDGVCIYYSKNVPEKEISITKLMERLRHCKGEGDPELYLCDKDSKKKYMVTGIMSKIHHGTHASIYIAGDLAFPYKKEKGKGLC